MNENLKKNVIFQWNKLLIKPTVKRVQWVDKQ